VFCIDLRKKTSTFVLNNIKLIRYYNREGQRLLRGTEWVLNKTLQFTQYNKQTHYC